jgi:hypothetical protein
MDNNRIIPLIAISTIKLPPEELCFNQDSDNEK